MGLDHGLDRKRKSEEDYNEIFCWRKENHFHKWFTDKLEGAGDNDRGLVSLDLLQEFLKACETVLEVLENAKPEKKPVLMYTGWKDGKRTETYEDMDVYDSSLIEDIMPTQAGFFFGGTNIDKWYLNSIKNVIPKIKEVIENHEDGIEYSYWSWW